MANKLEYTDTTRSFFFFLVPQIAQVAVMSGLKSLLYVFIFASEFPIEFWFDFLKHLIE